MHNDVDNMSPGDQQLGSDMYAQQQQPNSYDENQMQVHGVNQAPVQLISDLDEADQQNSSNQPPRNDQNIFKSDQMIQQQESDVDTNQNNNLATDDMMAYYEEQNTQNSMIANMNQVAVLFDSQPIRAVSFSRSSPMSVKMALSISVVASRNMATMARSECDSTAVFIRAKRPWPRSDATAAS